MKSVRYILSILTFSLFLTIKPETNSTPPTPAAPADVHAAEKQPAAQAQASAPAAQEKQAATQQPATQKTEQVKTAPDTPAPAVTTSQAQTKKTDTKTSTEKSPAKKDDSKKEEKPKAPVVPKEPIQITPEELLILYIWAGAQSKVQELLDAHPQLNAQAIKGKMGNSLMTIAAYNFFIHDKAAISTGGIFSNAESQIRDRYQTIMRALKARGATYNATFITPDNKKFIIPEHKGIKAILTEKTNPQSTEDAKKPKPLTKDQLLVLYTWAGDSNDIKDLLAKNTNLKVQDIADEVTVAPKTTGNSPLLIAAFNFITHDSIIQKIKDKDADSASLALKATETAMRDKYGAVIKDFIQRGAEYHPAYKSEIGTFDLPKNEALDALLGKK